MIAQAVNPVRNSSGTLFLNGVNLMDFLKGPKQFTPLLLPTPITIAVKDFNLVTGFIIPIYQRTYSWTMKECGQLPIAPLLADFDRTFFFTEASSEAKWKN